LLNIAVSYPRDLPHHNQPLHTFQAQKNQAFGKEWLEGPVRGLASIGYWADDVEEVADEDFKPQ
jgi:hypothetical protein